MGLCVNIRHRFLWVVVLASIKGNFALAQLPLDSQSGEFPACIENAQWSQTAIPRNQLAKSRVAVKTDRGQFALLDVVAGNAIKIESLLVYGSDGRRTNGARKLRIKSGYSFDIDAARTGTKGADLQWHAQTLGQQRLVPLNGAEIALCAGRRSLFRSANEGSLFDKPKRGDKPRAPQDAIGQ